MRNSKFGMAIAAKEHLATGDPLTRLEAMVLYGVANLPDTIKEMRNRGWTIKSRMVSYAMALNRINKVATVVPPQNLPVKKIQLTEYWVSK